MSNNRIYYATQQVGMKGDGDASYTALYGVQSAAISTTFNLEQVFELGQLSIYENIEGIPDVQITLNKVLDGRPLISTWASVGAGTAPNLAGRSAQNCLLALSIFEDTDQYASGLPQNIVECSGLFTSSISFTFGVDGPFTEDVTLVGNDKLWKYDDEVVEGVALTRQGNLSFDGVFDGSDSPTSSGGVNSKKNILFDFDSSFGVDANSSIRDPDCTVLPQDIIGITSSGTNEEANNKYGAAIQNITISTDLGRSNLDELGRRAPYHRTVDFPVEVTCEVTTISKSGDNVSATEEGILSATSSSCSTATNTQDRTIRVAICEGTRLYLGLKNRLQSVSYGGGDAGGGNANDTYSFTNFNDLTIMHSGDPNSNGTTWWAARSGYLSDLS